jgi:hypothetical protein
MIMYFADFFTEEARAVPAQDLTAFPFSQLCLVAKS